jgi:chemotaxis protein methyltransferase CheR
MRQRPTTRPDMTDHPLNELLGKLKRATTALAESQRPEPVPEDREAPLRPARPTDKKALIRRLMQGVEKRFGIHPTQRVEQKLTQIFARMDDGLLYTWMEEIDPLSGDHPEWVSLVESLTVHETYFCRDKPMLGMLEAEILPLIIADKLENRDFSLRVWSAGCSTGEETYNLAMLALTALVQAEQAVRDEQGEIQLRAPWRLDILGTDISTQVLRVAESATYADFGMGPFRELPKDQRHGFEPAAGTADHAFAAEAEYYRVKPFVSRHVRFRHHNLLAPAPPEADRDLVICRNVLIYFQESARYSVLDGLDRALLPGGALILGATDMLRMPEGYERRFGAGGPWHLKRQTL